MPDFSQRRFCATRKLKKEVDLKEDAERTPVVKLVKLILAITDAFHVPPLLKLLLDIYSIFELVLRSGKSNHVAVARPRLTGLISKYFHLPSLTFAVVA